MCKKVYVELRKSKGLTAIKYLKLKDITVINLNYKEAVDDGSVSLSK
jgi:hypothetical protein